MVKDAKTTPEVNQSGSQMGLTLHLDIIHTWVAKYYNIMFSSANDAGQRKNIYTMDNTKLCSDEQGGMPKIVIYPPQRRRRACNLLFRQILF